MTDLPADAASERLRRVLMVVLGGLALLACLVIASELALHLGAVIEARQAIAAARSAPPGQGPFIVANVAVNPVLVAEAILLEPLFLATLVGLWHLDRRGSFALALAGLVAFNLAAIAFGLSGLFLLSGWTRTHTLAAAMVPLLGLPLAEFALWTMFRPVERASFRR